MQIRRIRRREETYEEYRARIIAETSLYIEECLRHPEYSVRIPVVQADRANFPQSFSRSFWASILDE